ncbi:MAG: DNA gyrase/topoisomerase IV subunit A, partial [Bacteroidota bacterium]
NNAKLYADRKEGFIGTNLKDKKDNYVMDCSDIDDIIVFRKDGKFRVSRIADKVFMGKNIIHVAVWKKGDERTTYNMSYVDAKSGRTYVKRFQVTAITRDKDYDLTKGAPKSKLLYFSANPNGEAEIVTVMLSQGSKAKKKVFEFDFGELAIKGRASQGNILTKYPVRKVDFKEAGKSTLGALDIWMDDVSGRLNRDERGQFLGSFDTGDRIIILYKDGSYEVSALDLDLTQRFIVKDIQQITKFDPVQVINAIYFDGNKEWTMVKRFKIETSKTGQRFPYITDHRSSKLYFAQIGDTVKATYKYRAGGESHEEELDFPTFIDVKGWKALGNKLTESKLSSVKVIEVKQENGNKDIDSGQDSDDQDKFKPGDTIELF